MSSDIKNKEFELHIKSTTEISGSWSDLKTRNISLSSSLNKTSSATDLAVPELRESKTREVPSTTSKNRKESSPSYVQMTNFEIYLPRSIFNDLQNVRKCCISTPTESRKEEDKAEEGGKIRNNTMLIQAKKDLKISSPPNDTAPPKNCMDIAYGDAQTLKPENLVNPNDFNTYKHDENNVGDKIVDSLDFSLFNSIVSKEERLGHESCLPQCLSKHQTEKEQKYCCRELKKTSPKDSEKYLQQQSPFCSYDSLQESPENESMLSLYLDDYISKLSSGSCTESTSNNCYSNFKPSTSQLRIDDCERNYQCNSLQKSDCNCKISETKNKERNAPVVEEMFLLKGNKITEMHDSNSSCKKLERLDTSADQQGFKKLTPTTFSVLPLKGIVKMGKEEAILKTPVIFEHFLTSFVLSVHDPSRATVNPIVVSPIKTQSIISSNSKIQSKNKQMKEIKIQENYQLPAMQNKNLLSMKDQRQIKIEDPNIFISNKEKVNFCSACKILNSHLLSLRPVNEDVLKTSAKKVQSIWLEMAAKKDSALREVKYHLKFFEEFSGVLLQTILHSTDAYGNNVLHFAFAYNRFDLAEEFLRKDYSSYLLKKTNMFGNSPLMVCAVSRPKTYSDWRTVRNCFKIAGVNVNDRTPVRKKTALMNAAALGLYTMVQVLLDFGADPNLQDKDGSTALMYATEHGHHKTAKVLLRHRKCDPIIKDNDGQSACSIALNNGHNDVALVVHMFSLQKMKFCGPYRSSKRFSWTDTRSIKLSSDSSKVTSEEDA